MDLLEFLRARLDDDERMANNLDELAGYERNGIESTAGGEVVDYLDHFSPDRMLADVDAKRRIIDEAERAFADAERDDHDQAAGHLAAAFERRILPPLALPYAGHPDYRGDWRP